MRCGCQRVYGHQTEMFVLSYHHVIIAKVTRAAFSVSENV